MPKEAVHDILRGGYDKVYEAGALITGGHSILDDEPKYGLAVTGFVHPDKMLTNSAARPGDVLVLTKPIGIGVLTSAGEGRPADERDGGLHEPDDDHPEQGRPGRDGPLSGPRLHRRDRASA